MEKRSSPLPTEQVPLMMTAASAASAASTPANGDDGPTSTGGSRGSVLDKEFVKIFLQYGLVILIIAYFHHIGVPKAIEVYIQQHSPAARSPASMKHQHQHHNRYNHLAANAVDDHGDDHDQHPLDYYDYDPSIPVETLLAREAEEERNFDDDLFMQSYVCDQTHTYRIEVVRRDPLLMQVRNFLAAGEAEHMKALG